jgi:hypothetical protein
MLSVVFLCRLIATGSSPRRFFPPRPDCDFCTLTRHSQAFTFNSSRVVPGT